MTVEIKRAENILRVKTENQDIAVIKKGGKYLCLELQKICNAESKEFDQPRKDDIKNFYKVSGYIVIKGEKPRKVSVKIAEDRNGKKYYTLDARTDEQKKSLSTDTSLEAGLSKGIKASNLAYNDNISQIYRDVNIFFE